MEDLDTPRNVPGAADAILRQLEYLGLYWDGEVLYQSSRLDIYSDVLEHLIDSDLVYRCICTRREINSNAHQHSSSGPIYSGRCRNLNHPSEARGSWRLKVENESIAFKDLLFGEVSQSLVREVGDYILKRTDKIFAYQFATPFDDAAQGVNQVIRGSDLINSTPRQIYLLRSLNKPIPTYGHIPLALDTHGNKISKSSQVLRQIEPGHPLPFDISDLFRVLVFLGQNPPESIKHCPAPELLTWAVDNFKPQEIPKHNQLA
jgi:glutamyl-Q tRNA(Asp) synthetase